MSNDSKYGSLWSREELILAFYLYCQIPFARTKANNPEVIRLAELIGRTPSSVARKLGNFGAFDPRLAKKGITGLTHYGKADQTIWFEFSQNWDGLVAESNRLLSSVAGGNQLLSVEGGLAVEIAPRVTERVATINVRLGQSFFRRSVLSSYEYICCICGIDLPELLIASHIIPWAVRKETRVDPQNGLSLCALHDKAFDRGLITINPSYEILVSSEVKKSKAPFSQLSILNFDKHKIILPSRFAPKPEYLSWRMSGVFSAPEDVVTAT